MKRYIVTSKDGTTYDKEGTSRDNVQVLDFTEADNSADAIERVKAAGLAEGYEDIQAYELSAPVAIGPVVVDYWGISATEGLRLVKSEAGEWSMTGGKYGSHTLGRELDPERIMAHWQGYIEANGFTPLNLAYVKPQILAALQKELITEGK